MNIIDKFFFELLLKIMNTIMILENNKFINLKKSTIPINTPPNSIVKFLFGKSL